MKTRKKHYSVGQIVWIVVKYFSLIFFSFVAVVPIISCVITAFKTEAEYRSTNVTAELVQFQQLCGGISTCQHGKSIFKFPHCHALRVNRFRDYRNTACICVKPVPFSGKWTDSQPVFVRLPPSGCCNAGNGLPDYEKPGFY